MRVAYLILAHEHPAQLRRLVDALRGGSTAFFVHVDARVGVDAFREALPQRTYREVRFLKRRRTVHRSGFSVVEASLALLREALAVAPDATHLQLLDGACYPIEAPARLAALRDGRADHIELERLAPESPEFQRVARYHLVDDESFSPRSGEVASGPIPTLRAYVDGLLQALPPQAPLDVPLFTGSPWWSLTRATAEHALAYHDDHPDFVRVFRYSRLPEETFFHTILGNWSGRGPDQPPLHYAGGGEVLTLEHLEPLRASGRPFACNFDPVASAALLDRIDAWRGFPPQPPVLPTPRPIAPEHPPSAMRKISESDFNAAEFDQEPVEGPPRVRYVICSTQRSGSFLLCRLLYEAGIGIPTEYFQNKYAHLLSRRWKCLQALKDQGLPPYCEQLLKRRTRDGIFGAKLQYWQIARWPDPTPLRNLLLDSKVIFLFREDLLGQAVSLHLARASGQWGFDSKVTTAATDADPFDRNAITNAMLLLLREDSAWRMMIGRHMIPAYFLSYESLLREPVAHTAGIAKFLGVDVDTARLQRYWDECESVPEAPAGGVSKKEVVAWYREQLPELRNAMQVQIPPFKA